MVRGGAFFADLLADLELALELGWSGVALKACKCQSIELLIAAWAEVNGIKMTVQDLTCPGIALLQSVGLTARLNSLMNAVEANARQYFPETSRPEMPVRNKRPRTSTCRSMIFSG